MSAPKNDLADEEYKGEEMEFPNTFEEFANEYGFKDKEEVYTNGSELIPVFRVKQWLEHISTTKNDSKFCPDRKAKTTHAEGFLHCIENDCVAYKDGKCLKYNSNQEPTTKNNLAQECYQDLIEYFGDEKVAKTILESRKEFKAWLERLRWNVKRADELARELEQLKPTIKNNLGVDCVSRQAISGYIDYILSHGMGKKKSFGFIKKFVDKLPSVTPQPRKGHWYRQTNDFVDYYECSECGMAMGLYDVKNYCPNCGSRNEVEE